MEAQFWCACYSVYPHNKKILPTSTYRALRYGVRVSVQRETVWPPFTSVLSCLYISHMLVHTHTRTQGPLKEEPNFHDGLFSSCPVSECLYSSCL
jgi:hypothetical protein